MGSIFWQTTVAVHRLVVEMDVSPMDRFAHDAFADDTLYHRGNSNIYSVCVCVCVCVCL